jgi:2'-5' RNA ligase
VPARPRPPRPLRLFIALWPPASTRRALQDWQRRWEWPASAAVVAPEKLHLTLHFLGAVPPARLPQMRAGLAVPFAPFELQLTRVESWPRGLAALCPGEIPPPLSALQGALGDALRALDWPVEPRRYRPHISLARKAFGAVAPADAPALRWRVRSYALVLSDGGYRTLQRYGARAG